MVGYIFVKRHLIVLTETQDWVMFCHLLR